MMCNGLGIIVFICAILEQMMIIVLVMIIITMMIILVITIYIYILDTWNHADWFLKHGL